MNTQTLTLPLPETPIMKLEQDLALKDLEIEELKKIPPPLPESEWLNHFWSCDHISDCIDKLVELGYAIREEDEKDGN